MDNVWGYHTEQLGDQRIALVMRYECHASRVATKVGVRQVFKELIKQTKEALK